MTLFPNRYLVRVVGADGRVHTDYADHHLCLEPTSFLLKKRAGGKVKSVSYLDTTTGKPATNAEIYQH